MDFLLALIELFSPGVTAQALRAIIGSKSAILLQRGPVDPKFQVEGVAPTNHSSQKTRLNDLSYGIKIRTDLSTVLSQFKRVTDRRTDRQTELSSLYRICIPCSAVKIKYCVCFAATFITQIKSVSTQIAALLQEKLSGALKYKQCKTAWRLERSPRLPSSPPPLSDLRASTARPFPIIKSFGSLRQLTPLTTTNSTANLFAVDCSHCLLRLQVWLLLSCTHVCDFRHLDRV